MIEEEMGVTIIFPSSKKEDSIGMLVALISNIYLVCEFYMNCWFTTLILLN